MVGKLTRQLAVPDYVSPLHVDAFGAWSRSLLLTPWSEKAKEQGMDDALKCLAMEMGKEALSTSGRVAYIRSQGLVGEPSITITVLMVKNDQGVAVPFRAFWSAYSSPYSNLMDRHGYLTIKAEVLFEDIPAGLPVENVDALRRLKEESLQAGGQV